MRPSKSVTGAGVPATPGGDLVSNRDWTGEERRAAMLHIEKGFQQAKRGELLEPAAARERIEAMKQALGTAIALDGLLSDAIRSSVVGRRACAIDCDHIDRRLSAPENQAQLLL